MLGWGDVAGKWREANQSANLVLLALLAKVDGSAHLIRQFSVSLEGTLSHHVGMWDDNSFWQTRCARAVDIGTGDVDSV